MFYQRRRPLKWVFLFVGIFFAIISGNYFMQRSDLTRKVGINYSRIEAGEKLISFMKDIFSTQNISEILTDDLLIESFDYEKMRVKFMSKEFMNSDPQMNNMTLNEMLLDAISRPRVT
jgi:hypothetical protein